MVGAGQHTVPSGLLRIEDCLDARGGIVLPPGTTLISLIERNIASVPSRLARMSFRPASTSSISACQSALAAV